ncbi:Putative aliphatic sulfonates-binding protein precursor [Ewingella americana]|uniref:Putative aliphatic sulfonates-binding protein n=1 Tax=Ewingella americana TaxID=41202 RepID=A0A377NIS1_9GAMM|nr:Putative aliphatic sulfonates-binding protein precursor [Ewingella americana]
MVPENSPIKTVADLKGKRVALNKGSDVNYLLVSALENAGLKYKDVTPVYLPPSDARAAFQRGAVDAWVIWDPYLAEVETHEKARLVKNAEGLVPHYTFYLASRKFADTYPQTAEKVVDELKQLSDWPTKTRTARRIFYRHLPVWIKPFGPKPWPACRLAPSA